MTKGCDDPGMSLQDKALTARHTVKASKMEAPDNQTSSSADYFKAYTSTKTTG